jgi:hypothetical protein
MRDVQGALGTPLIPAATPGPLPAQRHPLRAEDRLSLGGYTPHIWRACQTRAALLSLGRGGYMEAELAGTMSQLDAQRKLAWAQAFLDGSFGPAKHDRACCQIAIHGWCVELILEKACCLRNRSEFAWKALSRVINGRVRRRKILVL